MSMAMEFFEEPEEEDVAVHAVERTRPLYSTDGPGDGRDWNAYFRDVKAQGEPDPDEDDEPEDEVEVIERSYDLQEPLRAPGAAGTLARRLATGGWDVRVRRSLARVPATLFKSDSDEKAKDEHRKGDVRYPAHELESFVVIGVKRAGGRMMALEATWTSKEGFVSAQTHDPVLGRERRTTVKAPRKPYAWEKEEGIQGTMGLEQWLNLTCPKPVKKTTPKEGSNAHQAPRQAA